MTLSTVLGQSYKSPLRCLSQALARSREAWKRKAKSQLRRNAQLQAQLEECQLQLEVTKQQAQSLLRQLRLAQAADKAPRPDQQWSPLPGHQFSGEIIALCCQIAAIACFRAVPKLLRCFDDALGLDWDIPSHDAVRNWTCRSGVALLQHKKTDDWIWMIDHSVQLGKMCVLVVLGIRYDQLPEGRPLGRSDMSVLGVLPSPSRNKQQVAAQLKEVADRFGTPLAVLSDGASELHAAAKTLGKVAHLSDIKHKISSGLKKRLGGDAAFETFSARAAASASLIRQTELDHLQPPRRKDKCRFMNIHREIDWARMVLDQLDTHADQFDRYAERMREKLGWVTEFRESIGHWQQCRQIITEALKMSNAHGVFRGATECLRQRLDQCPADIALVKDLRDYIVGCYEENEAKLAQLPISQQRLPCSTEVLESAFGSFKAMQRHHNRGTFTTLLAAFPTLFERFTPQRIREQLGRVSNKDLKQWLKDQGLLNSTQSRRARAYAKA